MHKFTAGFLRLMRRILSPIPKYAIQFVLFAAFAIFLFNQIPNDSVAIAKIHLSDREELRIICPVALHVSSDNNQSEIVIALVSDVQEGVAREFLVVLDNPDQVLLLDSMGTGFSASRIVSKDRAVVTLPIRLAGQLVDSTIPLHLIVRVLGDDSNEPIVDKPLYLPVTIPSRWKTLGLWLLDRADALALILALGGVWVQYRKDLQDAQNVGRMRRRERQQRQEDSRAREQRQAIEILSQWQLDSPQRYIEALAKVVEAGQMLNVPNSDWKEPLRGKLVSACENLYARAEDWRPLFSLLGQEMLTLSAADQSIFHNPTITRVIVLLDSGRGFPSEKVKCYGDIVGVCKNVDRLVTQGGTNVEELTASILRLYDTHSAEMRDFVAGLLRYCCLKSDFFVTNLNAIAASPRATRQMMSLFRHYGLKECVPATEGLYGYLWPTKEIDPPSLFIDNDISKWLKKARLKSDPFPLTHGELGYSFVDLTSLNTEWNAIERPVHLLIESARLEVASCFAEYLGERLLPQKEGHRLQAFPIRHILGSQNMLATSQGLAQSCAATWIQFLALNPLAFQELAEHDQAMLTELLYWSCGSPDILCSWLKRERRVNSGIIEKEDDPHFHWLLRHLRTTEVTVSPSHWLASQKILAWLNLRPHGYKHTYLIIIDQIGLLTTFDEAQKVLQLQTLMAETCDNLYLKLFVGQTDWSQSVRQIPRCTVEWVEALQKMLDEQVRRVSETKSDFQSLFHHPSPDLGQRVASTANGSVNNLFALGREIIRRHVELHPGERYIEESLVEGILQEWSRR